MKSAMDGDAGGSHTRLTSFRYFGNFAHRLFTAEDSSRSACAGSRVCTREGLGVHRISRGGLRTNANLPAGNTCDFNFTARGGGGIEIFQSPRNSIDFGLGWSHISNANRGVDNQEFNGIQVDLGYHWFRQGG